MKPQKKLTVGVRELHNRTSELLKAVEGGAELSITRHGKPFAALRAIDQESPYERLKRLGMIREATVRDDKPLPAPIKLKSGATVSDLLKEQQFPSAE